jgi:hypothetical protein
MFTTAHEFLMTMATILFLIGLISIGIGIFILASQAVGKNVQIIANQTTKLAQKGISEDISGLVGNASALLEALNQLVRSTAGIGIFLIIISLVLFAGAYGLILQLR